LLPSQGLTAGNLPSMTPSSGQVNTFAAAVDNVIVLMGLTWLW
jgi:hypothetical protein